MKHVVDAKEGATSMKACCVSSVIRLIPIVYPSDGEAEPKWVVFESA